MNIPITHALLLYDQIIFDPAEKYLRILGGNHEDELTNWLLDISHKQQMSFPLIEPSVSSVFWLIAVTWFIATASNHIADPRTTYWYL